MTIKQKDWKLKISSQTVANKETKSKKQKKKTEKRKSLKKIISRALSLQQATDNPPCLVLPAL